MKELEPRLQQLRRWRSQVEKIERRALQSILAERARTEERLRDIEQSRAGAPLRLLEQEQISGADLQALGRFFVGLEHHAARQQASLEDIERQRLSQNRKYETARRELKLAERLLERRLALARKAADREYQKFVDELSVQGRRDD